MNLYIKQGRVKGTVAAPPSKSYTHRLLICAALAEGRSIIHGIAKSQDILATVDCISALGATYCHSGDNMIIDGKLNEEFCNFVFHCRESGSTLRFFIPIVLIAGCSNTAFSGSPRLIARGISAYEELLSEKGISLEKSTDKITLSGKLSPGNFSVSGKVSSQFASGLLFALPLLDGESTLCITEPVTSRPYIDMTIDAMRNFGIAIDETKPNHFYIPGKQVYRPAEIIVEGDWSNAAALYAFNQFGGEVNVAGLNHDSIQGDKICLSEFEKLKEHIPEINLSNCPDLGPILFALAAAKHGAVFTGTERLRIKESDRVSSMLEELAKFSIEAEVDKDRVTIFPGELKKPAEILQSHNDHRIVMAITLLASITGGEISGAEAVYKSYPNFFNDLSNLGLQYYLKK